MNENDVFAPPQTANAFQRPLPEDEDDAKRIRQSHLRRESDIKALGLLTLIGGIVAFGGLAFTFVQLDKIVREIGAGQAALLGVLLTGAVVSVAYVYAGIGLRKLQPAARIVYTILSALTLVNQIRAMMAGGWGQVLGVLLTVIFLVVLWSGPAAMVFSRRYRFEIIPATPRIRAFLPWWFWVLLILFILFIVVIVFFVPM